MMNHVIERRKTEEKRNKKQTKQRRQTSSSSSSLRSYVVSRHERERERREMKRMVSLQMRKAAIVEALPGV